MINTTESTEDTEKENRDPLSEKIIGCAIEVHKELGPGLLESIYENALCKELEFKSIAFERQKLLPVSYKGEVVGEYRLDLLVENEIILELKCVKSLDDIFTAQLLTYMKISGVRKGLLVNFNVKKLINGIKRYVL